MEKRARKKPTNQTPKLTEEKTQLSKSSFEMVDHELKHSLGWDNDKLLVLFKNDK